MRPMSPPARFRTAAIWPFFVVSGSVMGTWSADIPAVRGQVGVSTAVMSVLLLMMGVATVCSGLLVGQLLSRFHSATLVRVGGVVTPVGAALAVAAPSPAALVGALVLFGGTYALLDVSMNSHGVEIESRHGVAVLSFLHAGWSIGGLVGAGCVALGGVVGLDYRLEALGFCALLIVLAAVSGPGLQIWEEDAGRAEAGVGRGGAAAEPSRAFVLPVGAVIVIGVLALILYSTEGVVLDWVASTSSRRRRAPRPWRPSRWQPSPPGWRSAG